MQNTELVMKKMWEILTTASPEERSLIANKLIRSEPLSFDQQISFEAAFHIAHNFVHGED